MSTIKDVAKEAGVSISTVSKIINNSNYGLPKTRIKVMEAIKKLGYQPNSIARSMVDGKTKMIAIVIPDIRNPFFTAVARGVEDVANKYNYRVLFCNTDEELAKQQNYINVFKSRIVDGFILAAASEKDPSLAEVDTNILPYVLIDRKISSVSADVVVVDNKNGAYKAVNHLLKLGYRRIGLITGKRNTLTGHERLQGYIDAHQESGVDIDNNLIQDGGFTIKGGYEATKKILNITKTPDALFISNNSMTIGCLKALSEFKIKICEDMAIIGFDDSDWAEFVVPPLTVIRQPTYTMGTIAGEMLFQKLSGCDSTEKKEIILNPELIVRESCGAKKRDLKI